MPLAARCIFFRLIKNDYTSILLSLSTLQVG